MTNDSEIVKWFRDNGDYTHNVNYNLNENSVIMDLGGYKGVWAQQMIDKYNPNVYILEPITSFYEDMLSKFSNNKKVHLLNVGIGIEDKDGFIFMNGDASSSNSSNGEAVRVKLNSIDTVLKKWDLNEVDLIQINIEGDEYALLEHMIENNSISKFKNIQVQFHLGIKNDIERRKKIRQGLIDNNFKINFDYPFVWESWFK